MAGIKKGQTHSEESKKLISLHHCNVSGENNPMWGKHRTEAEKENLRKLKLGKKHPNYKPPMLGKKHTEEYKRYMSDHFRGENGSNWQGGKTEIHKLLRTRSEYVEWRTKVFIRDGRKCVLCGSNKEINADHIVPVARDESKVYDLANGRTLCIDCHKKTDTYGWNLKWKEFYEQT
jgi:hypothetical protein